MKPIGSSSQRWLLLASVVLVLLVSGVWNGFACLSNPCVHGVCMDDLNSTYFCYCIDGYTGIQCQTNWNECWSSPCQNGGICVDGIAMFNCSCPPGFAGDLCEEDINECESNPCFNNGTCLDAHNGYVCNCLPGYSGVHCEIDVAVCNATNESRCLNGGICEEGPGETFTCYCQPGWGGFLCGSEVDECLSAPCQNGAICIDLHADYSCACLFGFTGRNCEEAIQICNKSPCKNGALCLLEENHPVCYCVPDFHGELCQFQYDECQLGPRCMNGGTCIDGVDNFTCSCPPNLTGVLCECLILGDNKLDCTYVSPTPIDTTTATSSKESTITTTLNPVTFPVSLETTEVPTTTIAPQTHFTDYFNESVATTFTSPSTTSSYPTLFSTKSTEYTTRVITSEEGSSTWNGITTITTESATSTESLTGSSTSSTTLISEEPPVTTQQSTEFPLTSTEITSDVAITEFTTRFPNQTIPTRESTITTIEFTSSPNVTILPPTSLTETTMVGDTTVVITTIDGKETNRSFPEETTYFPSITTFLSTELTSRIEANTYTSTSESFETTTASATTSIPAIDCTKSDSRCQNGGTCVFTDQGYKCICSFDTEGRYCETKLGVKNAAFNGGSYLSHRLLNFSHISIEFDAKTVSDRGLLFYVNIDTTYMALYVEDGYLKFKFSCGYQTMLLSELKVPVNNGFAMKIKAELEFGGDFKHCDATINVNNSLSMNGDQIAKIDQFVKPAAWLHLGSIPQQYSTDILPINGFIGCMTNLKISDKKINIYKDAEDGMEVTECSSLACLSNPCHNGASCSTVNDSWQCHCKNGYLGRTCDTSICDNNPCLYGGTCIPFTNSGYICLCPYGKHGHFCENDLRITEPYFSSTVRGLSSYVAYPIPSGISRNMELKFRFVPTSMEQISLLLFIGQSGHHDFYSDHLAVSFVKGYIMLTWNMGSGPRRIFTSQPVKKGARDYLVRLGHLGRRAWLYVENLGNVTGRSPGNLVQLDIVPLLFIGGHESRNFSLLPHDLPLHTGFSGCIFDIEMKSGSVVIPIQGSRKTFGRAVGQCGTTECYEQSCENGGACLHHGSTFMCLCQDNWYGPLCSSKINVCDTSYTKCGQSSTCVPLLSSYECDCPLGKTGQYCEKDENITDVSLTGKRSFIALHPIEFDTAKFNVEFEIRILEDQGVLMFIGKAASSFICLSLQSSILELRLQSGKSKFSTSDPISVRSSKLLVKGLWHKIQFGLFGRKMYLSVDNIINTGVIEIGHPFSISKENVFIGGFPDMSDFPLVGSGSLPMHFTGCVRYLSIDNKFIPLNSENIRAARNVIDCDGTPCGGESCLNGGTCWLDSFKEPHCSCVSPYYGDKCENVPECNEKMCKNQGKCYNAKCSCNIGWTGAFCENEIVVRAPELVGKSYLIVKKSNDKKRDLRDVEISTIYLNFTTAKPDSLLIWSQKGSDFIGLGIEKGLLKFAYSSIKTNKSIVEIPFSNQISDGLWHSIEVEFNPFSLKLDKKLLETRVKQDNLLSGTKAVTNDVFYIGGVPTSSSLINATNGMFLHEFEGCIESFGTNADVVTDFSKYEGTNIQTCRVLSR
ncbi:hypothetical protein NQ315_004748 [Exocentrus adspersus]|uniref:Protein eyes shut n=1 Tax=Exocentrus adspersus TaxID=1586481 RepID=A0AAV8W2S0_9CUCU|nr:hypothetical protein NQ315_004748 [Exocentrus adspersus]